MPTIRDSGRTKWTNWHQTVDQSVHQLLDVWNNDPNRSNLTDYNDTTRGIQIGWTTLCLATRKGPIGPQKSY